MNVVINRRPAGSPVGGQFVSSHRAGPAVVLQDAALLDELDAVAEEIPRLWRRQEKAARKAAVLELANVAQIAHEHGHPREGLLVIDSHARQVCAVDDDTKTHEVPQWWSEDLAKVDREVLVELPGVKPDIQRDRWTIEIGKTLDAERRLMGRQVENPIGYASRRDRAWDELTQARSEHIRAVTYAQFLQLRRSDERAAVLTFTPSAWNEEVMSLDEAYDTDGEPLPEDAYDYLDELGTEDCFSPHFSADQLRAAGIAADGPHGDLIVHFDRLARLRGVIEDPNQASLFGKDNPSDYGWRAAA